VLCIAKKLVPLLVVEATFFRRLIIRQNPWLNFPSRQKFRNELLPIIIEQIKERFFSQPFNNVIHALYFLIFRFVEVKSIFVTETNCL
jgi:hypothetical protein